MSDNCLLHDILHCLPPSSPRHKLVLTTWLLTMSRDADNVLTAMRACFLDEIKEGKWHIDKGLLRDLIRNGDASTHFHMLTSLMAQFLTAQQEQKLFLSAFKRLKKDDRSMMILSEVLHSMILKNGERVSEDIERYRQHIDFFVNHPSYKVRRFGIMSAVLLNPPERKHFVALKVGLSHPHDSLRLYCMTALGIMSGVFNPLPMPTIEVIRSVRLVQAVKKFSKRRPDFSGNLEELRPWIQTYELERH